MSQKGRPLVVIAGGGTGGHIYPGLAIARALQKQNPDLLVHFVGTRSGLETKIIPRENFPLHLIEGGKLNFQGQLLKKLQTLVRLPVGFLQSVFLLMKLKPSLVIGVGGYASGPLVLVAALMGKKTAVWEPNVLPGMANRLLSRFVSRCFVVFEESKKFFDGRPVQVVGMPVRAEIEKSPAKKEGHGNEFHILHYGGSQGSRVIGRTLCETILKGGAWLENTKITHQTGALDYQDFLKRYEPLKGAAFLEIKEFIYDMPKYYEWADLVICRGGASTLTEIAAFGLPAIVIPLPAADGHQEKNALALVQADAAVMIPQSELTSERLLQEIESLKNNPERRRQLSRNVQKFFRPQAAETLAKELCSLGGI